MDDQVPSGCTSTGRVRETSEIVHGICDVLKITPDERERHFQELASLLENGRPPSLTTTATTSSLGTPSNRSTQSSFASSTWSCISNASSLVRRDYQMPFLPEDSTAYGIESTFGDAHRPGTDVLRQRHRQKSEDWSVAGNTITRSSDAGTSQSNRSRCRRCCWCQQDFTRPHDFRKHVLRYCCGSKVFICRNQECRAVMSQEGRANLHTKRGEDLRCRHSGCAKIELQCKRQHFGCGSCAKYFDNLDNFIEHLGQSCRPDKIGRWHQSRQIRALLQQPPLRQVVEELSHQQRGSTGAYQALWWTWKPYRLERIIRKLEYGPKAIVDDRNPGIPFNRVHEFVRDLIQPSAGSVLAADFAADVRSPAGTPDIAQKELPPLPPSDQHLMPAELSTAAGSFYSLPRVSQGASGTIRQELVPPDQQAYNIPLGMAGTQSMYRQAEAYDPHLRPLFPREKPVSRECVWDHDEMQVEGGWNPEPMLFDDLDFSTATTYLEH